MKRAGFTTGFYHVVTAAGRSVAAYRDYRLAAMRSACEAGSRIVWRDHPFIDVIGGAA